MLRIWKLHRINMVRPVPAGEQRAIVVLAETEDGARHLAGESAGAEGGKAWLDADQVSCWSFGTADIDYQLPGVIARDFV